MSTSYDRLDDTLFSHYLVLYERQRLRGCSNSTRWQFRINLRHFGQFLGRPAVLSDLTDDTIADVMAWFVMVKKRAPRTANKFRDNMLALWRFLARKQIVSHWPDVEALAEPRRIPVAWTRSQLATLFKALSAQTGDYCGVPAAAWWNCLHSIAWDTGERISAILATEWRQLDLDAGWCIMRAESRKGRREDILSKLHGDTVIALRAIQDPERTMVFPWPYSKTYVWNRYKRILRLAGLPHDREHKFHCLRKSVASYFEAAGGDATKLLGHSARRVTLRYIDPRVVIQQHAADMLFRPDTDDSAA